MSEEPREPFRVHFVVGVTPTKWERVWRDRMRQPLELRPASQPEALAALRSSATDAAFLRDVTADDEFSAIRLYDEDSVVVASRDHLFAALGPGEPVSPAELDAESVLPGQDAETVELVAAGVGVARMPQSVARVLSRRDVVVRPLAGAPPTSVSLVWPLARTTASVDAFVGIVRGRTANSSR